MSHLLLFKTGDIVVANPLITNKREEEKERKRYKDQFSPSTDNMTFVQSDISSILRIISDYQGQVVLRSTDPNHQSQITEAIQTAMVLAKELKEQRMKAKEETSGLLMQQLRDLLKDN